MDDDDGVVLMTGDVIVELRLLRIRSCTSNREIGALFLVEYPGATSSVTGKRNIPLRWSAAIWAVVSKEEEDDDEAAAPAPRPPPLPPLSCSVALRNQ